MRRGVSIGKLMVIVAWIAVNVAVFRFWWEQRNSSNRAVLVAGLMPLGNMAVLGMARWFVGAGERSWRAGGLAALVLLVACLILSVTAAGIWLFFLNGIAAWLLKPTLIDTGLLGNPPNREAGWVQYGVLPVLACLLVSGPPMVLAGVVEWMVARGARHANSIEF